jgi:osmotically-inducible protein OsmY
MVAISISKFSREDVELRERVALLMQQRGLAADSEVRIEAHGGVVTLRGTVPTFYRRQLLYSSARRVAGVLEVVDELEVDPWWQQ